ncbi:MAG: hypothetical protein WBB45_04215 [Cyclobacteriaceae bacterium]
MSMSWRFYSFDVDQFKDEVRDPMRGPEKLHQQVQAAREGGQGELMEDHLGAEDLEKLKEARLDYNKLRQKEFQLLDLYYHRAFDTDGEVGGIIPARYESHEFAHTNVWSELEEGRGIVGFYG